MIKKYMKPNHSINLPETSGWDAAANEHPRIKWLYRILMGLGALTGIAIGVGVYLYFTPVMIVVGNHFNEGTIEYGYQRYEYWRYKQDIRSGYETHRDSNGKVLFRRCWKKNQFHGLEESWYPSSQIRNRCYWIHGVKDGLDQYWHPNGQLSYEVTWENSEPVAAAKQWDENGNEIPKLENLTIDIGGGIRIEFILVPSGKFMMGSNDGYDNEKPVHKVKISKPFYLGKYEVTQEQYEKVMGTNPSVFKGAKKPVESVSWDDVQEFCKRLSQKTNCMITLPTEAQWEYACRAGTTTKWHFGNDNKMFCDYAWFRANSKYKTQPVGTKKPNTWGLYDMHGNIREWCQDWFDAYSPSEKNDPTGPATGSYHILRGGCYYESYANYCRSAKRSIADPIQRDNHIGFRVIAVQKDE